MVSGAELLDLDRLMSVSTAYWLRPRLPDENVMFADVHWEVIKRIIPAYDRFVNLSTSINRSLSAEFDVSNHKLRKPAIVSHFMVRCVPPAAGVKRVDEGSKTPASLSLMSRCRVVV